MHMQNLKANTVRTAFCALLVSFALVFAGAAQVAVAPTNAYALDTAKCTAKPNVSGSSTVASINDERGGRKCMNVNDFIIVEGEETRVTKRMCKGPGESRYVLAA